MQNPVCAPSRASFFSGQYCSSLRIGTNGVQFPQDIPTLQSILHGCGYTTANIGKLHFQPHARRDHRDPPLPYGFDVMIQSDEPGCYDDAYTKWVERVAPEQLNGVRTMLPPAAVLWGKQGYSQQPRNTQEPISEALRDMTEEQWRDVACAYLAMVAQVDDGMGEILRCLKQRGDLEDTVIVFTSDHGEFLGDHGRIQKGMPGQDCITHVPCILSYPKRIAGGRVCTALTEALDIAPTILDYCGVQTPSFMQGKSLCALAEGRTDTHREDVLTEYFGEHGDRQTTIRTEAYKYYCAEDGRELLFDLQRDPCEPCNVASAPQFAGALSDMRLRMIRAIQRAAYQGLPCMDAY